MFVDGLWPEVLRVIACDYAFPAFAVATKMFHILILLIPLSVAEDQ